MTSFMVRILSSVRTAVSALKQQEAPVVRWQMEKRVKPEMEDKPQSGEQASKNSLYRHQNEQDGHSRKA